MYSLFFFYFILIIDDHFILNMLLENKKMYMQCNMQLKYQTQFSEHFCT